MTGALGGAVARSQEGVFGEAVGSGVRSDFAFDEDEVGGSAAEQEDSAREQLDRIAALLRPMVAGELTTFRPGQREDVLQAIATLDRLLALDAALSATTLDPARLSALQREALVQRAYCYDLLGTDAWNRERSGQDEFQEMRATLELALVAYERAGDPPHPWAHYGLATALRSLGEYDGALHHYGLAIETQRARGLPPSDELVYARKWRAYHHLRVRDYERALEDLNAVAGLVAAEGDPYRDAGWTRGAIARAHRARRDFAAARAAYEAIAADERDAQRWHAELGSIAWLAGDREGARRSFARALAVERVPSVFLRVFLHALAPEDEGRRADLRGLVHGAPSRTGAWDLAVGRFVLGELDEVELLDAALQEELVRGLASGDRVAEAHFYVGLSWELRGDEERAAAAYRRALLLPCWEKWEYEWARSGLARLEPDFTYAPAGPPDTEAERYYGVAVERWVAAHVCRADGGFAVAPGLELPSELRAGDLVEWLGRTEDGVLLRMPVVVDVAPH